MKNITRITTLTELKNKCHQQKDIHSNKSLKITWPTSLCMKQNISLTRQLFIRHYPWEKTTSIGRDFHPVNTSLKWSFPKDRNFPRHLTVSLPRSHFSDFPNCLLRKSYHVILDNMVLDKLIPLIDIFSLLSSLICLLLYWNCKEKFCLGHSWKKHFVCCCFGMLGTLF